VYTGASDKRPGLAALLTDAHRKQFDVVLVWKFDRFARSVRQLVTALETFNELGIGFVSAQEAIDTTTPYGKLLFVIVAAVGEIERTFIEERTQRRRRTVYETYKKKGRHWGRPKAIFDRELALTMRQAGQSWRQLARFFGKSKDTIQREITRRLASAGRARPSLEHSTGRKRNRAG
jgi:DNA invertase Pin-like site-specific DNA recombinase